MEPDTFMYFIQTDNPVAINSFDHIHPFGTIRDNHSNSNFIKKLKTTHDFPFSVLDIGCAGGGFVKELLENQIPAIGIEGSDINYKTKRAEWGVIPENLFTADVTKPFKIFKQNSPALFDVVTAWEFFEHIEKEDLPQVFSNLYTHLNTNGQLICSVSNFESVHQGVDLHRTKEDYNFWVDIFENNGFHLTTIDSYYEPDWVRVGTYNWVFSKK